MALWKRKKKTQETSEELQKTKVSESQKNTDASADTPVYETVTVEQTKQIVAETEKSFESINAMIQDDMHSGVILCGKKVSGFFAKSFWGALSIMILPPIIIFALGVLVIVSMLIIPLFGVIFAASVPAVLVTLSIFLIALPILFPLLVLFILITGKGRLIIGSEGKWFGVEMFGKSYSLKNKE
ncbi:MAG TPA: hypothetical protein ACFYDZ_03985 [Candidatus Brocadiaceae bacterium]